MRKTIYVKSEEIWDGVKLAARALDLSVSEYLLNKQSHDKLNKYLDGLIAGNKSPSKSQLDRIEKKLDKVLEQFTHEMDLEFNPSCFEGVPAEKISDSSQAKLEGHTPLIRGQAELDRKRAKRNIKKEKIAKIRAGYFNPQPKDGK